MTGTSLSLAGAGAAALLVGCLGTGRDEQLLDAGFTKDQIQALRVERRELARKPFRLMFNNDGCDGLYLPVDTEVTREKLLAVRTTPLPETQVDTLSYCTISSGFDTATRIGGPPCEQWLAISSTTAQGSVIWWPAAPATTVGTSA